MINRKESGNIYCSSTIDLFKLIASILVVFLHANSTGNNAFFNLFSFAVTPMAVPFYFIISGFFFNQGLMKANDKRHYFLTYEKKLLILYLLWSVVSLPFSIITYGQLYVGKSFWYIFFVIIRRYVLCGEGVFWYILVMAESAVVLYLVSKFKQKWLLLALIVIGLFLGVLYDNGSMIHNSFISKMNSYFYFFFSWSNNFIMKGIPFMGIGYIIYIFIVCVPQKGWIISAVLFLVTTLFNVVIYYLNYRIMVLFIIQAVAMSLFAMKFETKIDKYKSLILRELSSSIYFLHTFFLYFLIEVIFGTELFIPLKVLLAVLLCSIVYLIVKFVLSRHDLILLKIMFNIKSGKLLKK